MSKKKTKHGPMDAFLGNRAVPPKKTLTVPESQSQSRLDYEKKRERKFVTSWKNEFPWLETKENDKLMICKVCIGYETTGPFVTGCPTMHKNSLWAHQTSDGHRMNVQKDAAKQAKPGSTPADLALHQLNQEAHDRLCNLYRNAHALAKHGRPFSDFTWICSLDIAKGVKVDGQYRNDKQAAIFCGVIAQVEVDAIKDEIKNAKFVSAITDGSTDSSYSEAEIFYVRYAIQGKIKVKFIAIKNVKRGDAETISRALLDTMRQYLGEETVLKIVGLGTDGASVMQGKKSGVVKRVRDELSAPYIVGVHCAGHRLELAFKDCIKQVGLFDKLQTLLVGLYYYYRNSPLNRSNLKESYSAVAIKPLMPTRVGGTRWVGHQCTAIDVVRRGYSAFRCHLQQVNS
jgi:hypothetical protein